MSPLAPLLARESHLTVARDGAVVRLCIDRPSRKNAVTVATLAALRDAARALAEDRDVRVVLLTAGAAAGTFLAGADIDESLAIRTEDAARAFSILGAEATAALAALPTPTVAVMDGATFGGGLELALACDVRLACGGAPLAFVHARMGLTPSWGTTRRLVAAVGAGRARELLLTARAVPAEEAAAIGLVHGVATPLAPLVEARVAAVLAADRGALAAQKRLLAAEASGADDAEREAFVAAWTGDAHWEAVERFLARRGPPAC